jgi:hypothetical protein
MVLQERLRDAADRMPDGPECAFYRGTRWTGVSCGTDAQKGVSVPDFPKVAVNVNAGVKSGHAAV